VKIHRCYRVAIIQAALLTVASPVARAEATTTDEYVTRKEYDELKAQLLAMKKELDAIKKEKTVAPKRESSESRAVASTASTQGNPDGQDIADSHKQVALSVPESVGSLLGTTKFLLAGWADGMFEARNGQVSTFSASFNPIFLWELTPKLLFDSRLEIERSLSTAVNTWESAKAELAAMIAERDAYVQNWHGQTGQALSESSRKLSDARESLNKAQLRKQLVELRADRDATVLTVAKVSVGSVLQSGQQFITLIEADAPLEIEANISGRDDGFVHVGDPVAIKFDTFPFVQYGMAYGTVRTISADSFTAQDDQRNPTGAIPLPGNSTEPFYRARVTIDRACSPARPR